MHASISAHIAGEYLLDEAQGIWGPSQEQFDARLAGPEASERVANLYFAYLFVLRAVLKAAPVLARVQYTTGDVGQDALTADLVHRLVRLARVCALAALPQPVRRPDGTALHLRLWEALFAFLCE